MIQEIRDFFSRIGQSFERSDLRGLDPQTVQGLARDIGVTTDDLYTLDRIGAEEPVLMPQRLSLEGVSPAVVQAEWPSVWKDLQRVCSLCESKDVCKNEFELAPDANDWRRYCANEGTIKSLQESLR